MDGSHASVANGLLESGVLSVIGTFAPVDSAHTAIFVSRLLHRVSEFVPIVTAKRSITWREVVAGFLRMSYVTDVLRDMRHVLHMISDEQYHAIHSLANMWINTFDESWFERFIGLVKSEAGVDDERVRSIWGERYQFVETMIFVQLGRPENIVIVDG